jgi:hypothetical protein
MFTVFVLGAVIGAAVGLVLLLNYLEMQGPWA